MDNISEIGVVIVLIIMDILLALSNDGIAVLILSIAIGFYIYALISNKKAK
jgi:hypothetical protein